MSQRALYRRSAPQMTHAAAALRPPHEMTPVKPVYKLSCRHCHKLVCCRGMRAILLADSKIELYSTDIPSSS